MFNERLVRKEPEERTRTKTKTPSTTTNQMRKNSCLFRTHRPPKIPKHTQLNALLRRQPNLHTPIRLRRIMAPNRRIDLPKRAPHIRLTSHRPITIIRRIQRPTFWQRIKKIHLLIRQQIARQVVRLELHGPCLAVTYFRELRAARSAFAGFFVVGGDLETGSGD